MFCARWIPKILMEVHKFSRMGTGALEFLSWYHTNGKEFLNKIVTCEEICIAHVSGDKSTVYSMGLYRFTNPTLSVRKLMVTVFWDAEGILLVEFMTRGTTINSEIYSRKLKKL
ncbi:histone-lysine N-methyltransferase SETMAR [Trichonephila clavata]|uniref:Histone-lysine N-methyltransferase SETMAR n=1 Tax=Trichonephila clavata TaxID=2740835 RepID=A0A8X6KB49_TRICU|nr:histone-lysine N-methyltransferase SETMAR [Trichonephila clavata]